MAPRKNYAVSEKKRPAILAARRNAKMARSAHAYMRGNTVKFYEWLASAAGQSLPDGPAVWICGDCHVGNLGPVADIDGHIDIQIRDLDQTVIGNPAHDLIRLALSLATAARGSNLPGVLTARMVEAMVHGYEKALKAERVKLERGPEAGIIQSLLSQSAKRRWKHLAHERIADVRPTIPRSDKFWHPAKAEQKALEDLATSEPVRALVTSSHSRKDTAHIELLDCAYWVKGCSSLGRVRYALLVGVDDYRSKEGAICLLDLKEATTAAAPRSPDASMPHDNAARVVEGAKSLAPNLGERMLATRMSGHSIVARELLPQDLKLEMEQLTPEQTAYSASYLAGVVGLAHGRQMDELTRRRWLRTLQATRSKKLDAPSWLWNAVVDLIGVHESAYLEHSRRYGGIS